MSGFSDEFLDACATFGIDATRRQQRKWDSGRGRAYVLAEYFDAIHERRSEENSRISAELAEVRAELLKGKNLVDALKDSGAPGVSRQIPALESDNAELERRLKELESQLLAVPAAQTETQQYLDARSRDRRAQ